MPSWMIWTTVLALGLCVLITAAFLLESWAYWACAAVWDVAWSLYDGFHGLKVGQILNLLWFIFAIYMMVKNWKNRKPRKAYKLIGAKAKAIRDKLVKAMPKAKPIVIPGGS